MDNPSRSSSFIHLPWLAMRQNLSVPVRVIQSVIVPPGAMAQLPPRENFTIYYSAPVCSCRSWNVTTFSLTLAAGVMKWKQGCNGKTAIQHVKWKPVWQPPRGQTILSLNFEQLRATTPSLKNNNTDRRKPLQLSGHSEACRPSGGWL